MKFDFLFLLIVIALLTPQNSFCENNLTNKNIKNFFITNAQNNSNSNSKNNSNEDLSEIEDTEIIEAKELAKENNIDSKSKWYKKIKYRLKNEENFRKNNLEEKEVLFKIESKEKLFDLSYRNKKPLTPEPPEFVDQNAIIPAYYPQDFSKIIEQQLTPPFIPPCLYMPKETIPNPMSKKIKLDEKKDGYIYFDALILSKSILNSIGKDKLLNKDFFGNKNTIHYYSNEPYDTFSLMLGEKKLKCLPARIIVTKNNITRYYGVEALLNYDFDKNGAVNWKVKKNLIRYIFATKDKL